MQREIFSAINSLGDVCEPRQNSWEKWQSGTADFGRGIWFLVNLSSLLGKFNFSNRWGLLGRWQNFLFFATFFSTYLTTKLIVKLHVRLRAIELNMHKDRFGIVFYLRKVRLEWKKGRENLFLFVKAENQFVILFYVRRSIPFLRWDQVSWGLGFSNHFLLTPEENIIFRHAAMAGSYRFHSILRRL